MIDLSEDDRLVYRELLKTPGAAAAVIGARGGLSDSTVDRSVGRLVALGLVTDDENGLHAVPPQLGYARLIGGAEEELRARRSTMDRARTHLVEMSREYSELRTHEAVVELTSLDAVRERLTELSEGAIHSCLSFTPQRTVSHDTMDASRPLNALALGKGVVLRCIYPDSLRNDPETLEYARWLTENGGELRTVPVVPLQMVVVDASVALLPIDPENARLGALEIRSPGMILALVRLFESQWAQAVQLGDSAPRDVHGLTPQEAQLMRLLAEGHTDESAARRLQVSVRTIRRIVAELTERLEAHSRFEAGAKAAARGWI
ncbi:helix-turn-helix domain-containing protein [Naumannella cuiyingiana]|uniref:DNA-binding CsgD family transcriptional regulator n=1 Tax=Naumannella cuiyingiana TaxID=1347891 RepID=A0A7Z0IKB8_9ACTN|nr:helix-turn-helix transcriptional regulator [Naumannella cuiyingiana]NYI70297.1 DNA-binding CsgD family transcriptional regulator [Naumannella cuiyingiana]